MRVIPGATSYVSYVTVYQVLHKNIEYKYFYAI